MDCLPKMIELFFCYFFNFKILPEITYSVHYIVKRDLSITQGSQKVEPLSLHGLIITHGQYAFKTIMAVNRSTILKCFPDSVNLLGNRAFQ